MLPYKWTVKKKDTGEHYWLISIGVPQFGPIAFVVANKKTGEFEMFPESYFYDNFILVEEEPNKRIPDKGLENYAHKGKA